MAITSVKEIPSNDWSLSLEGLGLVVTGEKDIKQCVEIILATPKGSNPMRPLFGCDAYKYLDKPITIAGPKIVEEIIDAVSIWEKRAKIEKITYALDDDSSLVISIYMTVISTKQALFVQYPGNGFAFGENKAFGDMFDFGFF